MWLVKEKNVISISLKNNMKNNKNNKSSSDELGDRAKAYENVFRGKLPGRMPFIIRCDGKAFHTLTKKCIRPYDTDIVECMEAAAKELCKQISSAKLAYVQSDEISILVTPYEELNTQPWFDGNIQKIVSIASSIASTQFTKKSIELKNVFDKNQVLYCNAYEKFGNQPGLFDARVFVLPENDVNNIFYWRQKDAERNSIQMLASSLYSHKELDGKVCKELKEMCTKKNRPWESEPTAFKRGFCIKKSPRNTETANGTTVRMSWAADKEIPMFSQDKSYIQSLIPGRNTIE